MCESLIIALQSIEGFSIDDATGNFGNGTKSRLPIIPYTGSTYTSEKIGKAILLILLNYSLLTQNLLCIATDIVLILRLLRGIFY